MALTRVNRHQQSSATGFGAGAFTTSAFTPANNTLLVVVAHAITTSDTGMEGTDLTITDSAGLTWTSRVATTGSPAWSYGARVWTAPVMTGASMTVSVDCGAFSVDLYRVEVFEYSDYSTATPVGGTATGTDVDGDGAVAITLSQAPEATSEVLAFVTLVLNSSTSTVTPGSGWTELFESSSAAAFITTQSQVRASSTSTSVGWDDIEATGDTAGAVVCAVEIRQGSAPPRLSLTIAPGGSYLGSSEFVPLAA